MYIRQLSQSQEPCRIGVQGRFASRVAFAMKLRDVGPLDTRGGGASTKSAKIRPVQMISLRAERCSSVTHRKAHKWLPGSDWTLVKLVLRKAAANSPIAASSRNMPEWPDDAVFTQSPACERRPPIASHHSAAPASAPGRGPYPRTRPA